MDNPNTKILTHFIEKSLACRQKAINQTIWVLKIHQCHIFKYSKTHLFLCLCIRFLNRIGLILKLSWKKEPVFLFDSSRDESQVTVVELYPKCHFTQLNSIKSSWSYLIQMGSHLVSYMTLWESSVTILTSYGTIFMRFSKV